MLSVLDQQKYDLIIKVLQYTALYCIASPTYDIIQENVVYSHYDKT